MNPQQSNEEMKQFTSPEVQRQEALKQQRKEALNKHGVIPEFIKITEIY